MADHMDITCRTGVRGWITAQLNAAYGGEGGGGHDGLACSGAEERALVGQLGVDLPDRAAGGDHPHRGRMTGATGLRRPRLLRSHPQR
jgi:hypothetical protein